VNCGGKDRSVGPATYFFVTDGQKRDYLSRASQRARGATKNRTHSICYSYYVRECCNAGWSFSGRKTGNVILLQGAVGLQQQQRRRRLFTRKTEIAVYTMCQDSRRHGRRARYSEIARSVRGPDFVC